MRNLVFILLSLFCLSPLLHAEGKPTIGVLLPLSGDGASIGKSFQNGILLGYENLPKELQDKISIVFEDDGLQSVRTVAALRKLQSTENLIAVLTFSSGTSHAIAPIVEKAKLPLVAIASDPRIVKDKDWVVNFWVTPEEENRVLLPEALRRGYKKIAIICDIHEGVYSVRRAFDKINNGQIEVVFDEEVPLDMKDFRTILAKLKTKEYDAIMPLLFPGQLSVFAQQARKQGITAPFFGYELFEDRKEVEASEGTLVGAWYANADDPSQKFLNEYEKRFPDDTFYSAPNGYDAIHIIAEGFARGGSRESVREFLHSVKDFPGVMGKISASGDNRFNLPAAIKLVTKDGFKLIS
ncbi:MAG: ABC transporter substrate-binding protein [Bdellovibrionales bacterium]|nr:ABC transporter substrate-binding protein [Bdellovibrionales bacterium]